MIIRLRDKEFAHIHNYCGYDEAENIVWDRTVPDSKDQISVFTERMFGEIESSISKIKIAWLLEPEVIHAEGYNFIRNGGYKLVDYVLTNNMSIIKMIPNGIWWPSGGTWLFKHEWGITSKKKNVSIIASSKTWTDGHRKRHEVISILKNKFDFICGRGYIPLENKKNAFIDYRFTVCIHNCDCPDYFTDLLIDPILLGTIPIIWTKDKWIGKYFNDKGFFTFYTILDLQNLLELICKDGNNIYNSMLPYVKENFEISKKYAIVEDYLYDNFFKQFNKT